MGQITVSSPGETGEYWATDVQKIPKELPFLIIRTSVWASQNVKTYKDLIMGRRHKFAKFTSMSSMGLMGKYQSKGHL